MPGSSAGASDADVPQLLGPLRVADNNLGKVSKREKGNILVFLPSGFSFLFSFMTASALSGCQRDRLYWPISLGSCRDTERGRGEGATSVPG